MRCGLRCSMPSAPSSLPRSASQRALPPLLRSGNRRNIDITSTTFTYSGSQTLPLSLIQATVHCRRTRLLDFQSPDSEVLNDMLCRACHQVTIIFPNGECNKTRRGHEFILGSLLAGIPDLYETEDTPLAEKLLHVHYFVGGCDWYVAKLDHETGLAFGHADLGMGFPEWGYFDRVELEQTIVQELFVIERELHFTAKTGWR